MERITERYNDGYHKGILVKESYAGLRTLYEKFGNREDYLDCEEGYFAMEKLAKYEDLEEQGKLLRLPCKVGDTVYILAGRFGTFYEEDICDGFYIGRDNVLQIKVKNDKGNHGTYGLFGKYVTVKSTEQPCNECIHNAVEKFVPQTNADRIRAMGDEELAAAILSSGVNDLSEKIPFCNNEEQCTEILENGIIPDEMCKQCLMKWLQSKVEE